MNLNQLIGGDEEIQASSLEFDPSLLPENQNPPTSSVSIQDKIDESVAEALYGPHIDPDTLPSLRTDLKDIEDTANKADEFHDVLADIQEANGVSQDTAVAVESIFGGFLGNTLRREQFTSMPSRINMGETVTFINRRIATENASLSEKLPVILTRLGDFLKNVTSGQTGTVAPLLAEGIKDYRAQYELVLASIEQLENTVIPVGDEFIDVKVAVFGRANFDEVKLAGTNIDQQTYETFLNAFYTISSLLKCHWTYGYLYAVIKGEDAPKVLDSPFGFVTPDSYELSVEDFLMLYKDDRLVDAIEKTTQGLVDRNTVFETLSAEFSAADKVSADMVDFSSRFVTAVSNPVDYAAAVMVVMKNLTLIHSSMAGIIQFLDVCQRSNISSQQ